MQSQARLGLILLLCFYIVGCCLSLIYVANVYVQYEIAWFDEARLFSAALAVGPFAVVSLLFVFGRFSFGYFAGFYFYTMILGYLWLAAFSQFHYDHASASTSAFVSALAFLAPALFITSPIRQRFVLSARALDHLLSGILILAATIIAVGTLYNFRLVSLNDIYSFRGALEFPAWLSYAIGATSGALLPFAFACFVAHGNKWRATFVLLLLLLIYPITLTKLALFAPFWLVYVALLSRFFGARTTVVLSLFLPLSAGIVLAQLVKSGVLQHTQIINYFGAINFRMIAFPSIALDLYNHFFSTHTSTHFCQISFLKSFMDCPYTDPLAIVMAKAYQLGNLNASLFATEGIASVGPVLAPLAAFVCGLVIAVANRLSAGLSPRFVLISGALIPNILLNVPLSITLLTYGAGVLFLLWYVTPRTMFEPKTSELALGWKPS
ncbi:hypothetical protein SAMN05444159_6065 [Bradyrhizobium lablabi]|uniref:Oligosaccharide repeat unit polymerase n=2 Tax=Bradyrhizobium lablabi TaxID=722472 RepID=A0A1M7B724_9BRAD|nr:hypothetical protein SAMN05444159_6065 [Bradyrhizobium lablabi]